MSDLSPIPPVAGRADESTHVRLVLPVRAELWVLARMSASALAARLDFGVDAVEDLRLAIDELCNSCATGANPSSSLTLDYTWDDDSVHVACAVEPVDGSATPASEHLPLELSRRILAALVDAHEIGPVEDDRRRGWLIKRRAAQS